MRRAPIGAGRRAARRPRLAIAALGLALAACGRGSPAPDGEAHTGAPPVLAFDPRSEAMIGPGPLVDVDTGAEAAVLCFFPEVLEKLAADGTLSLLGSRGGESGPLPVYALERGGARALVIHPGVGAPLAASRLERLIAGGVRRVVAVGGAGVLSPDIGRGDLVVPTLGIRGEGTSYSYLPPGAPARPSEALVARIRAVLDARGIPYALGATWTTDAVFRETRDLVARRRAEGALVVEMEFASLCAVAAFRGVDFAQILYGGDDLSGAEWDHRNWRDVPELREGLLGIAVDVVLGPARARE